MAWMGRPTKTYDQKRQNFTLRLTAADRAAIDAHAACLGITTAEFVRRRAMNYRLPENLASRQASAALATAGLRLGVNLNQIAKHMNAGRDMPAALLPLLDEITAWMDGLYDPGADRPRDFV
jgi:hypothetical protein